MPTTKIVAMSHWMFNCKRVSEKVSMSMDQSLPLYERMMISVHLWMCKYCRRLKKHMLVIRKAVQVEDLTGEYGGATLSLPPDARKRIKKKLTDVFNAPAQPQ